MAAIVSSAVIATMGFHDHHPTVEGWRRVLDPLRKLGDYAEPRTLKERGLAGVVLVGLLVLTPTWIALLGWLLLRLILWLFGA